MRLLGLIGGMSWQSTAEYYRRINEGVASRLGGLHSATLLIHSVNMARVAELQAQDEWEAAGGLLGRAAAGLERAGAQALVIASNTMHRVSPAVERAVGIPLLHIVDPIGVALRASGVRKASLLGTRYDASHPIAT